MILFVFEGGKAEPTVFRSIENLYLSEEQVIVIKYGCDLPTLYKNLNDNDYDLFRTLPFAENGITLPEGKRLDTLFSQIFLFFDYDFQNRMPLEQLNNILESMLEFFDDETINGKLYINYPMVESLKYTKELPDENYWMYVATRQECQNHQFKGNAEHFAYSGAKGYRFIDLSKNDKENVLDNWNFLKIQNVSKANYVLSGNFKIPETKELFSQRAIFDAQKQKYVDTNNSVAILNSFPLFIYEYLK